MEIVAEEIRERKVVPDHRHPTRIRNVSGFHSPVISHDSLTFPRWSPAEFAPVHDADAFAVLSRDPRKQTNLLLVRKSRYHRGPIRRRTGPKSRFFILLPV